MRRGGFALPLLCGGFHFVLWLHLVKIGAGALGVRV
jgi:hypothetical protein